MTGFFESIAALKAHRPLLAAWGTSGKSAGAKALFAWESGRCEEICKDAAFPAACAERILNGSGRPGGTVEWAEGQFFLEQITAGRKLVICGAGHVSMPVVRIGRMLDYEITVIDDRKEFTEKAREAGAQHVVCRPFGEALDGIGGDPSTAFVIMTREHAYDMECLRLVLGKPRAYAGMMGSRSRTEQIRKQLLEEGFDAETVREVHMPIGLPIGSRTPEEIAVSVTAELIRVMNASDAGEGFPPGMAEELAALEKGEGPAAVLAMIVEKNGEAPRRPGTKMLVKAGGQFLGTVGGGSAEAAILKTAGSMLREGNRETRLVRITMQKGTMHCGGEITVFLLPIPAGTRDGGENR